MVRRVSRLWVGTAHIFADVTESMESRTLASATYVTIQLFIERDIP